MDWYNGMLRLMKHCGLLAVASFPGCVPTASLPGSLGVGYQEPSPWLASKEPWEGAVPCHVRGLPPPTGRPGPGPGTGLFLRGVCVCVWGGVCSTHEASRHVGTRTVMRIHGSENSGASGGPSPPRVPRASGFPL